MKASVLECYTTNFKRNYCNVKYSKLEPIWWVLASSTLCEILKILLYQDIEKVLVSQDSREI